ARAGAALDGDLARVGINLVHRVEVGGAGQVAGVVHVGDAAASRGAAGEGDSRAGDAGAQVDGVAVSGAIGLELGQQGVAADRVGVVQLAGRGVLVGLAADLDGRLARRGAGGCLHDGLQ